MHTLPMPHIPLFISEDEVSLAVVSTQTQSLSSEISSLFICHGIHVPEYVRSSNLNLRALLTPFPWLRVTFAYVQLLVEGLLAYLPWIFRYPPSCLVSAYLGACLT